MFKRSNVDIELSFGRQQTELILRIELKKTVAVMVCGDISLDFI